MIDSIPVDWLFESDVPLFFFIIALLTKPSTWSKTVIDTIRSRFESS